MEIRLLTTDADLASYDAWSAKQQDGTLWQSLAWKTYQEALGRSVRVYGGFDGDQLRTGALVVIDRTAGGYTTWDIPRGPVDPSEQLLRHIEEDAARSQCLCLFFSPLSTFALGTVSPRHEQPEATRIVDLRLPENEILMQMKPKGRYNIGVAQKYALEVKHSKDIDAFHELLVKTGGRDGFKIGPKRRYQAFLDHLPGAFLLLAYHTAHNGGPIAGFLGAIDRHTGIYYYGASDYEHRQMMAPYLLQWEAMRHCAAQGCSRYDLLGVAPPDAPEDHPWQGISSFKEKFGGQLITYPPERMLMLRPWLYKALQLKRKFLG